MSKMRRRSARALTPRPEAREAPFASERLATPPGALNGAPVTSRLEAVGDLLLLALDRRRCGVEPVVGQFFGKFNFDILAFVIAEFPEPERHFRSGYKAPVSDGVSDVDDVCTYSEFLFLVAERLVVGFDQFAEGYEAREIAQPDELIPNLGKLDILIVHLREEIPKNRFERLQIGDDGPDALRVIFRFHVTLPPKRGTITHLRVPTGTGQGSGGAVAVAGLS
jgi:hypothetical protein